MMALLSKKTHDITLKNLTLFRPKLRNSLITNQMQDLGANNELLRQVFEDSSSMFWSSNMENVALIGIFCTHQVILLFAGENVALKLNR